MTTTVQISETALRAVFVDGPRDRKAQVRARLRRCGPPSCRQRADPAAAWAAARAIAQIIFLAPGVSVLTNTPCPARTPAVAVAGWRRSPASLLRSDFLVVVDRRPDG